MNKVGFIGAGNIATAIINGAINSGYIIPEQIYIFDLDSQKLDALSKCGVNTCASEVELTKVCDYVFLTIKPQVYESVLNVIAPHSENTCFIDVAAGISIDYVKSLLGNDTPVIRVMPNTPLMYGCGASALVKVEPVTDEQFSFVKGFFESCGVVATVEENLIDTVIAISGSAPAYIMRFANQLITYGSNNGLTKDDASKLVLQTLVGCAKMINSSDKDVSELIRMVTSPNGTTQAGLESLDKTDFDLSIKECLDATVKRAKELSK